MAEASAPAKGLGGQLGKKVGPFPLGVWLAGGVGVLLYLRKKQSAATSPGGQTQNPGYGTDPAGNFGLIDPNTGYVAGSSEDLAAQQLNSGVNGTATYGGGGYSSGQGGAVGSSDVPGSTITGSPSPGGSTAVGSAASPGPSGTSMGGSATGQTNQSGTSVTTPGAPAGTPKVTTPGAAKPQDNNWRYPAPTGLAANSISDSGFRLSWNPVQGPNGQKPWYYTTALWQMNGVKVSQQNVSGTASVEYGPGGKGLHPGWQYKVLVWADGGPLAPPGASIVVTVKQKGQK